MLIPVNDKHFYFDDRMHKYAKLIAKRITADSPKFDYVLLVDGYEGYGKSNWIAGFLYVISQLTGRELSLKQIFFKPDEMMDFALNTSNQLIWWDEAAFGALAAQHGNKLQVKIIQMLNMARKKRHLFIITIPRFYRMKEHIIERCNGLVHVYARKQVQIGRFRFYKKDGLDALYDDWKRTKRKPNYGKYASCRGSFAPALPLIVNEEEYDNKKDEGIIALQRDNARGDDNPFKKELRLLKYKLTQMDYPIINQTELRNKLNIPKTTFHSWAKIEIDKKDAIFSNVEVESPEFCDQTVIVKGVNPEPSNQPPTLYNHQ